MAEQNTDLIRWTQETSGAAGRVNVGLCPAPNLFLMIPVRPIISNPLDRSY